MQHAIYAYDLGGRVFLAPVSKENLHHILDVRSGVGVWAVDVADESPPAQVLGFEFEPHTAGHGSSQLQNSSWTIEVPTGSLQKRLTFFILAPLLRGSKIGQDTYSKLMIISTSVVSSNCLKSSFQHDVPKRPPLRPHFVSSGLNWFLKLPQRLA